MGDKFLHGLPQRRFTEERHSVQTFLSDVSAQIARHRRDSDPKSIGKWIHGRKVQAMGDLIVFVRRNENQLGVRTAPSEAVQSVVDQMVRTGIKGIWNFSPVKLRLRPDIVTQKENLAEGFTVSSHKIRNLNTF